MTTPIVGHVFRQMADGHDRTGTKGGSCVRRGMCGWLGTLQPAAGRPHHRARLPRPQGGAMTTLTYLSLFSGIGGLDLGLDRAGWTCVGQVERDEFCQRVLAKHWPEVPRHEDVRTASTWWTSSPRPAVGLVAGGFPCQDVSDAGRRAGIEGEQSGLWAHFAEMVGTVRPRYVLVENATGLLARGMGRVLGDLADLGYDAEWDCVPAASVGAPHLRARLWILAYPRGVRDEANDAVQPGWPQPQLHPGWAAEPDVGRLADGLPRGMAGRLLKPLGNAVVPQVGEHVGRLILAHAEAVAA